MANFLDISVTVMALVSSILYSSYLTRQVDCTSVIEMEWSPTDLCFSTLVLINDCFRKGTLILIRDTLLDLSSYFHNILLFSSVVSIVL